MDEELVDMGRCFCEWWNHGICSWTQSCAVGNWSCSAESCYLANHLRKYLVPLKNASPLKSSRTVTIVSATFEVTIFSIGISIPHHISGEDRHRHGSTANLHRELWSYPNSRQLRLHLSFDELPDFDFSSSFCERDCGDNVVLSAIALRILNTATFITSSAATKSKNSTNFQRIALN